MITPLQPAVQDENSPRRRLADSGTRGAVSAIKHLRMARIPVRWLQHAGQLVSEAVTGRRLSLALLLATLAAHLVCVSWVAAGGAGAADQLEVYLPLVASAVLAVAMFAMRRAVRVRAASIARAAAVLIAVALLDGPPVFVPALLAAPLLIEPVLYDDDRVGMALAGAYFVAALAVLGMRAAPGAPATAHYLATFALVTGLPAGLGWAAAFHRERVVELTARVQHLDSTIGRLAHANREFQVYAGTVKSESAAEERSRITRELHDTVGYALTNVIVMMDAAKARAREEPEALDSLLDDVRAQSERALDDTRRILHLLRSVEQFERKGIDAIFQLTRAFQDAMGLSVELHVGNLPATLGPRIDSVLFRLVQEGLTNAFRHGNASRVRITMWQAAEEIRVGVWDNGTGLPADGIVQDGIGMSGMRERFAELGGTIRARNVLDGFQLSGTIPYAMGEIIGSDQGSDSG